MNKEKNLLIILYFLIIGNLFSQNIYLDFSDPTLQMMLDGGVRPQRVEGPSLNRLQAGPVNAEIFIPECKPLFMKFQSERIEVLSDYRISIFDGIGESTSIDEGIREFKKACAILGVVPEGFDEYISKQNFGQRYATGTFRENLKFTVGFVPLYGMDKMGAYVYFGFSNEGLTLGDHARGTWKTPIEPPPGYEGFSFDRPKPTVEAQKTNAEVAASAKPISSPEQMGLQKSPSPTSSLAEVKPSPVSRVGWPIIIGLVVLIGGIIAWLKLKR